MHALEARAHGKKASRRYVEKVPRKWDYLGLPGHTFLNS